MVILKPTFEEQNFRLPFQMGAMSAGGGEPLAK